MGGKADLPRINEVVAFLDEFAPNVREDLAQQRPQLAPLLVKGIYGGDAPKAADEDKLRAGLDARAEVLAKSIGTAVSRCEQGISEISSKLARARRFRFFSAALAAIGASSVIGAAFVGRTATLIAGAVTLASNLAGLFAGIVILGGNDRDVELTNLGRRLAKSAAAAELTGSMLAALQKTRYDTEEMKALLQSANELFAEMTDALSSARD